MIMYNI